MKSQKECLYIIIIMTAFLFHACGSEQADWQGTVEVIEGVTFVKNPGEPIYGELLWDLEEDLSIGSTEDDNYMFYRVREIKADNDGNIYVLEHGNLRVQKFDRTGLYQCPIGKQGQGPGEYQAPRKLLIDEVNELTCVLDMRKLIVFDKAGNYLDRDIAFDGFFYDLLFDSRGSLWGVSPREEGEDEAEAEMYKELVKVDEKGQFMLKAASFPYDMYRERMGQGVLVLTTGEEYDLFMASSPDSRLAYGYSKEYELHVLDLEGTHLVTFTKDEPYRDYTPEQRKKQRKAKFPDHKPFFYDIFTDSEGRIYTKRNNTRGREDVEMAYDVFSKDGYYLYRTVFPHSPYVIKDGFFYTLITDDETGDVFVKRFKIRNWDEIKARI